jgi:hypothetical protein
VPPRQAIKVVASLKRIGWPAHQLESTTNRTGKTTLENTIRISPGPDVFQKASEKEVAVKELLSETTLMKEMRSCDRYLASFSWNVVFQSMASVDFLNGRDLEINRAKFTCSDASNRPR